MSVASLINLSITDGQKLNKIYEISNNFLMFMFFNKKWFHQYCDFLFKLLKIIGYEIDYLVDKKNKYFDLDKLIFIERKTSNSIEFPFDLLNSTNTKLEKYSVNHIFIIFETVFVKNHLSNFNLSLPNQYHLFKKLIVDKINLK